MVGGMLVMILVAVHQGTTLAAVPQLPQLGLPLLVTSGGQSPDAMIIKMLCDEADIKADFDQLIEAGQLKTGIKTMIIAVGLSMKGLGAAGVDEDYEISRIDKLLTAARKSKVYIVGAHIGGNARRGGSGDRFVNAVIPRCDLVIVKEEGNEDGLFSRLTASAKIPLVVIEEVLELRDVLPQLFRTN
jgi:hypothetical protein